jgi:hypothetical protein
VSGPDIRVVDHADEVSCAFCGSFASDKALIVNQHEGVGSLICQSCVNALDAFFITHPGGKSALGAARSKIERCDECGSAWDASAGVLTHPLRHQRSCSRSTFGQSATYADESGDGGGA